MSALFSKLRDRLNNRKWLSIAVVLGLLLVAYVLPPRLAQRGVSSILFLVALPLAAVVLPRVWLGLMLLLIYGPFAATVRFSGVSNLQSLLKDLFVVALAGFWLFDTILSRRRLERSSLTIPLLLYFVFAAVQALRAPSLLRGALALKILFTYVPVFFLIYYNPPSSRRQLEITLWLVFIVAAVTALYGFYQYQHYSTQPSWVAGQIEGQQVVMGQRAGQLRIVSTFSHSTVFSLYLSLVIVLGASLMMATKKLVQLLLLVILALLIGILPLTLSRIGWIGLGLGLIVLAVLLPRGGKRILIVALVITGLLGLFYLAPSAVQETLGWSFTSEDVSFTTRGSLIYWAYIMTFREFPLGCGVGTLSDSAELVSRVTGAYEPGYVCFYHGVPVNSADTVAMAIGVQMGAIGYLLFLLIHGIIWWQGIRIYRHLCDPFLKALGAGLLAYLAIMTFSNFFSGSTQAYPVVDLYFWFFVGLLMSLKRIEQRFLAGPAQ